MEGPVFSSVRPKKIGDFLPILERMEAGKETGNRIMKRRRGQVGCKPEGIIAMHWNINTADKKSKIGRTLSDRKKFEGI